MTDLSECSSQMCHWCSFNLVSMERFVGSTVLYIAQPPPISHALFSHTAAFLCTVVSLILNANVPYSRILSTMKMEEARSSETSVLTTLTQCHIPEDTTLQSHHQENLKSYICWHGLWHSNIQTTAILKIYHLKWMEKWSINCWVHTSQFQLHYQYVSWIL
jgi:hypothetical protein